MWLLPSDVTKKNSNGKSLNESVEKLLFKTIYILISRSKISSNEKTTKLHQKIKCSK